MTDFFDTVNSENDWKTNSVLTPLLKSPNPLPAGITPAMRIKSELDWKRDQTVNAIVATAMTNPTPTGFLEPHIRYKTNQTIQNFIDDAVEPVQADLTTKTGQLNTANQEIAQLRQRVAELEAQLGETDPEPTTPTGPGYVAYATLGVSNLRDAVNKVGLSATPQKITFAPGAVVPWCSPGGGWGTNRAVVNFPKTVIGIVGDPANPVKFVPPAGTFPAYDSTAITDTNPYHIISATAGTFEEFSNVLMEGNSGQLHGGVRLQNETKKPLVKNVRQVNCAPGNYWSNPEETFGINFYRCLVGVTIRDYSCDGQNNMASSLGFNSTNNVDIDGCDVRNCYWGMPTIWKGKNATIRRLVSINNHIGMNFENVGGVVKIYEPEIRPFRGDYPAGGRIGANPKSNLSAMHFTCQSNRIELEIEDFSIYGGTYDTGLHNGWPTLMNSKPYTVGGGNSAGGTTQVNKAANMHFYPTGSTTEAVKVDYDFATPRPPATTPALYIHH